MRGPLIVFVTDLQRFIIVFKCKLRPKSFKVYSSRFFSWTAGHLTCHNNLMVLDRRYLTRQSVSRAVSQWQVVGLSPSIHLSPANLGVRKLRSN